MDHIPEIPHHNNAEMMLIGFIVSMVCFITTEAMTGQALHLLSVLIGAVLVFLVQKLMHFIWDKYVLKK